ncbi:hypothetical protein GCM10017781_45570 [Deinococcus metalli]|nr:hypothetical protein GCM10017781_45570 [Deinococcus metalli]
MSLKPQHARFLLGYQQHRNATRAAIEAGYLESNAAQAGSRLLKKPAIMAALAKDPPGLYPLVNLPSGVQLGFSFEGRPISPDVALALAQECGSPGARSMWVHGLAMLTLLTAQLGNEMIRGCPGRDGHETAVEPSRGPGLAYLVQAGGAALPGPFCAARGSDEGLKVQEAARGG